MCLPWPVPVESDIHVCPGIEICVPEAKIVNNLCGAHRLLAGSQSMGWRVKGWPWAHVYFSSTQVSPWTLWTPRVSACSRSKPSIWAPEMVCLPSTGHTLLGRHLQPPLVGLEWGTRWSTLPSTPDPSCSHAQLPGVRWEQFRCSFSFVGSLAGS